MTQKPITKLKSLIVKSLNEDKAEDIVAVSLKGKTDFADYMVVATGRSSKHVISIADKLVDRLGESGLHGVNVEGREKGDWVLIDAHDVIVHVFRQEVREAYDIEKIWQFKIERSRDSK